MLRALATSFIFFLTVLLAACGGDDPGTAMGSPGPTATAQGNVVKGLVRNGVVRALRWQNDVYVEVVSARTGADGSFTLTIPAPVPGEVLRLELDVAGDGSTQMQCDVADCGFATRGEWGALDSGLGLASWASVAEDGNVTVMPMTPVSTLLVRYAESLGGGHLTATGVAAARQRIAAMFGLSQADLLVRPGSIVDATWMSGATPQAVKLSLLSAAFAELADRNGTSIDSVIDAYATAFTANSGHLVQDGAAQSLGELFRSLEAVLATGADPTAVQGWMTDWADAVLASLQVGRLNTVTCAGTCPAFDSNDLLAALGTGADTLGGDLLLVMQQKGADTLEQLVANELAKYGWLISADSAAVAEVALQIVEFGLSASLMTPPAPANGLTPTLQSGVLHVTGTHANGMDVDITVELAPVLALIQEYDPAEPPQFTWGVSGTVQNGSVRASIDGSFTLDSTGTDLTPLRDGVNNLFAAILAQNQALILQRLQALLPVAADILRSGEATFTLQGSAGIAKLEQEGPELVETSRLAIEGRGWMHVEMDGGSNGAIAASGAAEYGQLTLPGGDWFQIDPEQGHSLTFALATDGTATATFAANVLSHAAEVSGSGTLANLGALLTNARNNIAGQLDALGSNLGAGINLPGLLAQLLTDFGNLGLTVSGQADIPSLGHTYTLTIANGHLGISQPDSSEIALDLSLGGSELLLQAGGKWWLVGLDLQNYGYPALVIADSSGGEWSFDLTQLLAAN
jgi:hypothetical protein